MARVRTMSGIASISGRLGNYCFRTMKATGKVYMHPVASKERRGPSKPPSAAMIAQRERFKAIVKMMQQMQGAGSRKSRKQLWKIATEAYDAAHK